MIQAKRLLVFIAFLGTFTLAIAICGCSQKVSQGKYSEEEMLDIPQANR